MFTYLAGASSPPAVPVNCKGFQAGHWFWEVIEHIYIYIYRVPKMTNNNYIYNICYHIVPRLCTIQNPTWEKSLKPISRRDDTGFLALHMCVKTCSESHQPNWTLPYQSMPEMTNFLGTLVPNGWAKAKEVDRRPWALRCWTNWTVAFATAWAMRSASAEITLVSRYLLDPSGNLAPSYWKWPVFRLFAY